MSLRNDQRAKSKKSRPHTFRPNVEVLEPRIALHGAGIEVESQIGFRPLDGSIVSTTSPTVRISIPAEHIGMDVKVFLDDLDRDTPREEITDRFPTLQFVGVESAVIDLGLGAHAIEVQAGRHVAEATMLNIRSDMAVVSSPVLHRFTHNNRLGTMVEKQTLLLNFVDETPLNDISNFLGDQGFTPLDIVVPMRIVRVELPERDDPVSMADELTSRNYAFLEGAVPNITLSTQSIDVAGESMPSALTGTYDIATGGFGNDGYRRTKTGGLEPRGKDAAALIANETHGYRHHFLMDTFAGHRLVETLVGPASDRNVAVAVIDTGFGNGAANPNPTNIPDDSIISPTRGEVMNINAEGQQETVSEVRLQDINDVQEGAGHGTAVAAAVAGRGSRSFVIGNEIETSLGIGRDLNIRPIRPRTTINRERRAEPQLLSSVAALQAAALDPSVFVINTSFGGSPAAAGNIFKNVAKQLKTNNKIWVAALGNFGTNQDLPFPAALAPGLAPRTENDFLIMAVSATGTMSDISGPEKLAVKSNFGPPTSVSALGEDVILPGKDGTLHSLDGTSFSAPLVSGLAGEMIYLDRNFSPSAKLAARQIIELIEATADDLGSTVTDINTSKPNNSPNNGRDDAFGHGRINVWKAMLAVANRGIASTNLDSQKRVEFPSLNIIGEATTAWYGFKIRTNRLGAIVWIDGEQLTDGGSAMPLGPNITAYAGVQPHVESIVGDRNQTTYIGDRGTIPIGTEQGEYVTTFSIRRSDLVQDGRVKTLSLRIPGQGADDRSYFNLPLDLEAMRASRIPGVSFDDFVFEITPTDFGDAPDSAATVDDSSAQPGYPTNLRYDGQGTIVENGARHLNSNFEWLGSGTSLSSVSAELNANTFSDPDGVPNNFLNGTELFSDLDRKDDGVRFFPMTYRPDARDGRLELSVSVAARDMGKIGNDDNGRYSEFEDRSLYVNAWIDWNGNQAFEESNFEHVINGLQVNPARNFQVVSDRHRQSIARLNSADRGNTANFRSTFRVGSMTEKTIFARVRLDYGENAGKNDPDPLFSRDPSLSMASGAALFGEVEDYQISVDFGDAKDPFAGVAGQYPTKRSTTPTLDGARHLDTTKEWFGESVTREFDTDSTSAGDVDPIPNLGVDGKSENLDHGDDTRVEYKGLDRLLRVSYTVTGSIASLGFTHADTPVASRVKGRYDSSDPAKRIYVNIWSDWNGNGTWDDAGEHVLANSPVDPATFGLDGKYTLGDRFEDINKDGVYEPGIDTFLSGIHDIAGMASKAFSSTFRPPAGMTVASKFYVRMRLTYGEPVTGPIDVAGAYSVEPTRNLSGPRGAALFGEVEDIPVFTGSIRGQKWQDFFENGIHDLPLEPGLNGWLITLFVKQGEVFLPIATQVSMPVDLNRNGFIEGPSEAGLYEFNDLPPGIYFVGEGILPLWTQMYPSATSPGSIPLPIHLLGAYSPFSHRVILGAGETALGKDFGNAPPRSAPVPSWSSVQQANAWPEVNEMKLQSGQSEFENSGTLEFEGIDQIADQAKLSTPGINSLPAWERRDSRLIVDEEDDLLDLLSFDQLREKMAQRVRAQAQPVTP